MIIFQWIILFSLIGLIVVIGIASMLCAALLMAWLSIKDDSSNES